MRYVLLNEDPEEVPTRGGDPQEEREQDSEGSHAQLSQQEAECTHADAMPHSPQDDLPQEGSGKHRPGNLHRYFIHGNKPGGVCRAYTNLSSIREKQFCTQIYFFIFLIEICSFSCFQ